MGKDQTQKSKKKKSQLDTEWENRTLCSDGNCIGVIGPDGHCKECGKPYEGRLPWQVKSEQPESVTENSYDEETFDQEEKPANDTENNLEEKSQDDMDWENRRLCSDESCIGVIGTDGHCKECGKPYDGETNMD